MNDFTPRYRALDDESLRKTLAEAHKYHPDAVAGIFLAFFYEPQFVDILMGIEQRTIVSWWTLRMLLKTGVLAGLGWVLTRPPVYRALGVERRQVVSAVIIGTVAVYVTRGLLGYLLQWVA